MRSALNSSIINLITQRSQVQILPPQPKNQQLRNTKIPSKTPLSPNRKWPPTDLQLLKVFRVFTSPFPTSTAHRKQAQQLGCWPCVSSPSSLVRRCSSSSGSRRDA